MSDLKHRLAGRVGGPVVSGLFVTTTTAQEGREQVDGLRAARQPVVFVFWHAQLLLFAHHHRGEGIVALVSEHGDGEYLTQLLLRKGFRTSRGSSTRGAIKGLKGLVRAVRAGGDVLITPDGPRGPKGHFKPGAVALASMTGAPIVPVSLRASHGWRLNSWDRFFVPRPFSELMVEYHAPVHVPKGLRRQDRAEVAAEIGTLLNESERAGELVRLEAAS